MLAYCEKKLGRDWLATWVGRILPSQPSSLSPAIFLVVPDITDVTFVMESSFAGSARYSPMPSPRPGTSYNGSAHSGQDVQQSMRITTEKDVNYVPPTQIRRKSTDCWKFCCFGCFPIRIMPARNATTAVFAY